MITRLYYSACLVMQYLLYYITLIVIDQVSTPFLQL